MFVREGLEDETEWVRECAEKISFKPICLVPKSIESENVIRFEGVARLLAQQEDGLRENNSNGSFDEAVELTLSSHPGMAICVSDRSQIFPGLTFHNLCLGPKESAIKVKYDRNRFAICDDSSNSCLVSILFV